MRFSELHCREVINLCDGARMGEVCDLVFDPACGQISAIVVPSASGLFGMFSREGCIIDSSCKMFVQTEGTRRYEGRGAGYISVFSLTDSSRLAMRGLKYGGEDMTVTRDFPLGVSNNFREEYGEIQVYEGKILVIIEY